jgi:hypothetical protein
MIHGTCKKKPGAAALLMAGLEETALIANSTQLTSLHIAPAMLVSGTQTDKSTKGAMKANVILEMVGLRQFFLTPRASQSIALRMMISYVVKRLVPVATQFVTVLTLTALKKLPRTKGGKPVWVKVLVHEGEHIQHVVFLMGFHMRHKRKDLIGDF